MYCRVRVIRTKSAALFIDTDVLEMVQLRSTHTQLRSTPKYIERTTVRVRAANKGSQYTVLNIDLTVCDLTVCLCFSKAYLKDKGHDNVKVTNAIVIIRIIL